MFISVRDADKRAIIMPVKQLCGMGFQITATEGTAGMLARNGIPAKPVSKLGEGSPHVGDMMARGEVALVINTPKGSGARRDGDYIRTTAVRYGVPCITTLSGLQAAVQGIADLLDTDASVTSLQEFHA